MNKVLLDLGFIEIRWYSIIMLLAILSASAIILKEAKKKGFTEDFMNNLFFYTIICAIIGARLYYVAFNFAEYQDDLLGVLRIWEGGLAIHGGIIGGLLFISYYAKKYKVNLLLLLDIIVVGLILGQIIGRWGNFMNSEAYGPMTTYATLKKLLIPEFIIKGMSINGVYYHPTFWYESILNLVGLIILLIIRKGKYTKVGTLTGTYLIWYGAVRIFIESLRQDALMLGPIKIAQLVSIIMIIIGIIIIVKGQTNSKFENNYKEANAGEIKF